MRSRLLLLPVAVVASAPAHADSMHYLTIEQAQKLLFPGASFKDASFDLTDAQFDGIREQANETQWVRYIKAWRTSTGGWFIVDEVPGRDDMVFYAIGLDASGAVTGIEIMVCTPQYAAIRNPAWLKQFVGARNGQYDPERIASLSGNSLSSTHVAGGVKRVLYTWQTLLKQRH